MKCFCFIIIFFGGFIYKAWFVSKVYSWFVRDFNSSYGNGTGIFTFVHSYGYAHHNGSFRVVPYTMIYIRDLFGKAWFVCYVSSWFLRSDYYAKGLSSGVFTFEHTSGHAAFNMSFRVVLYTMFHFRDLFKRLGLFIV